jgi:hypothetical protein
MTRNWGKGDMKELKNHPRLAKLVDAVRNRPNMKTFLELARIQGVSVNCVVDIGYFDYTPELL